MKANRKFRSFKSDENAAINMIIMGLLILVISVLAVAIIYPMMAGIDYDSIDRTLGWNGSAADNTRPSQNASNTILSTTNTVMGLNPLAALVAVAAGIISLLLGAFLVGGGGSVKL